MIRIGGGLIGALMMAAPTFAQPATSIVNTWDVVSADQVENGQTKQYLGPDPQGRMMFTSDGLFSIVLLRSDIPKFQSNSRISGTPEENAAVVRGSLSLYGTYELTGDTLKLHIKASSFPNWNGTDQTRIVHVSGDRFVYENAASSAGGGVVKIILQKAR